MVERSGEPLARGVLQHRQRQAGAGSAGWGTGSCCPRWAHPQEQRALRHSSTASWGFVDPGIFCRTKAPGPGQRLPWEPSRLLTRRPALPPAPAPLCFFRRPFEHAPPCPVLPACEQLAAGATVHDAGRWPSGGVAGSPGQDASLLMVASFSEEFQNGGSSACLPIVRHGYALPYFSPGSDSSF